MSRTVRVVISGRVQGVSYRFWTQQQARQRALVGWVRNLEGGEVEAVFSGAAEAVDAMLEACRQGPPAARVERIETFDVEAAPSLDQFTIKYE